MSAVNSLLSKAVTSLRPQAARYENEALDPAPSTLKASDPLVFPSPDFKLEEKEEVFLLIYMLAKKTIIHQVLFDFELFFKLFL